MYSEQMNICNNINNLFIDNIIANMKYLSSLQEEYYLHTALPLVVLSFPFSSVLFSAMTKEMKPDDKQEEI